MSTLGRRFTADVKLLAGPTGAKHNGGIVVNYRPHASYPHRRVYYVVEIDRDAMEFRISYFNGTLMTPTSAFVSVPGLQLNRWYRITVTTAEGSGDNVEISATIANVGGTALAASLGPLVVSNYIPDTGYVGLHADRAETRFGFVLIEEVP